VCVCWGVCVCALCASCVECCVLAGGRYGRCRAAPQSCSTDQRRFLQCQRARETPGGVVRGSHRVDPQPRPRGATPPAHAPRRWGERAC
jgi:hypothetical protein